MLHLRRQRRVRTSHSSEAERLQPICARRRYRYKCLPTGPRSSFNIVDSATIGLRREAQSKNTLNVCISASGTPPWSGLMPVVSPMKVLYFETTHVNSVTKQCIRKPGISEIAWSWPKFPLPRRGSRPEPQKPMKFAVSRRRISMRPLRSAYYGEDQKNGSRVMRPCSGTLRDSAQFVVSNSPISRTGEDTCGKSTSRRGRRLKDILVALPLECSSLGHASFAESTSPKPRSYIPKSAFRFSSSHIFNTMDDQSALKEVAKLWGTTSPMAPMSDDELVKDQPHKFPKPGGSLGCERQKGPGSRDRPQPRCQLNNSR